MSAKEKDLDTENKIKETAKKIFFGEGRFNATTQEIADAAGINRTLINYYFRSRDNLFQIVFEDAQKEEFTITERIATSELGFKEKLESHLDFAFEQAKEYPYLDIYMVTQMNQGGCFKQKEFIQHILKDFYKQIEDAMDKGLISRMKPEQFLINFISLSSFPMSMRPLLQETMGIKPKDFEKLLEERKKIIIDTLFIK